MALPVGYENLIRHHSKHHQSRNTDTPPPPSQTIETPHTDRDAASHEPFRFFHLPLELRCIIYREAIASGSTSILRTCRFAHGEACRLVPKAGISRISAQSYGPYHRIAAPPADFLPSISIRNVEIRVSITPVPNACEARRWPEPLDMGCIASFTGAAALQRHTCSITFRKCICTRLQERPEVLLDIIRKLRGFKRIIVTAIASGCDGDLGAQGAVIRARNKSIYKMALEKLEAVFGPGVWHDAAVQEGRYLEFRPKQG